MGDKYTEYPDHLKRRIEAVDKFMVDVPRFRAWWDTLSEEEKTRLEALSPEERQKEISRLRGMEADPNLIPNPNLNQDDGEETVESLKEKLAKTEQKYRTLQGMIKEPAELERQNNLLLQQTKTLQDKLYALEHKEPEVKKINVREALKPHYDKMSETLAPDIVEEEIKKDERLFELLESTLNSRADQRISEVVTRFDGKMKVTADQQFQKDLADWGDWRTMWNTPEFQAFLSEEADVTGVERYAIIQDAFNRLDSRIVLKAFDMFTAKSGGGGGARNVNKNIPKDGSVLKNRISAPRSSGASNPSNQQINSMSPQEARRALSELAANYSRGLFKGNKDDYDKEYARLWNLARGGTG